MKLGAITIDTNIFHKTGYKLESGLLAQLYQFKQNNHVQVVLSDIVLREIEAHLLEAYTEALASLKKGIRNADHHKLLPSNEIEKVRLVMSGLNLSAHAQMRIRAFCEMTGAEIVSSENFSQKEVLHRYFNSMPPFAKGEKKHEFPDAIALLTLEKWAVKNKQQVLVVSDDRGWCDFCKQSDWMDCISFDEQDKLPKAIATFQTINLQIEEITRQLEEGLAKQEGIFEYAFETAVSEQMSSLTPHIDSRSQYDECNAEDPEIILQYYQYKGGPITLLSKDTDTLVFQVKINVTFDVRATFTFYRYNAEADDFFRIFESDEEKEIKQDVDILLTLQGDYNQGYQALRIGGVEIVDGFDVLDFGYISSELGYEE